MNTFMTQWPWAVGLMFCAMQATAQEHYSMKLPQPQFETGMPLMKALRARQSTREFDQEKLSPQILSDLLWAAFGVNRPESEGRTAPSTRNWQDIDIYVAASDGLYLFDAKSHTLKSVQAKDIRALTGTQDFVGDAPINLIYVSDFSRMDSGTSQEDRKIAAAIDAGFIGENVYLYCASVGLATVVRGSIDKDVLAKAMKLHSKQWIVVAQSVGYPKTKDLHK